MAGKTNKDDIMKQVLDRIDRLDDKIEKKLDKVEDRLDSVDKTLLKQESQLAEHMRRTDILEKLHDANAKDIATIKKPFIVAYGIGKILGFTSLVIGIILGIAKIIAGL